MSSLGAPFDVETLYEDLEFQDVEAIETLVEGKEFIDCAFTRCNFFEAHFKRCRFEHCSFNHSDLSMAKVTDCSFVGVCFKNTKALGINWTAAKKPFGPLQVSFHDSVLNYASFFGMELKGMKFIKCNAHEVNFSEADLSEAVFEKTDLKGTDFLHTDLTKTDFRSAKNYAINLNDNTVTGAQFSFPEAVALLKSFDITVEFGQAKTDDPSPPIT